MRVCVYEDGWENFYPVAHVRPVFELVCGHESLRAKIERRMSGNAFSYAVREDLAELFAFQNPDLSVNESLESPREDMLFLNGRLLASTFVPDVDGPEEVAKAGPEVVYLRAKAASIAAAGGATARDKVASLAEKLPVKEVNATVIGWIWELIHHNPVEIENDFRIKGKAGIEGKVEDFVAIRGDSSNLFIAPGAVVQPMVVIDVEKGPVTIGYMRPRMSARASMK